MENLKSFDSLRFIKAQTNAIATSKYIESQKFKRDLYFDEIGKPSQGFYVWWIKNHADKFRKAWYTSSCRKCSRVEHCNNCLKNECKNFDFEPEWKFVENLKKEEFYESVGR
jgi:hypothetical protein